MSAPSSLAYATPPRAQSMASTTATIESSTNASRMNGSHHDSSSHSRQLSEELVAAEAPPPPRPTHIEVCARIRPLLIEAHMSSSSFFGGHDAASPHMGAPTPSHARAAPSTLLSPSRLASGSPSRPGAGGLRGASSSSRFAPPVPKPHSPSYAGSGPRAGTQPPPPPSSSSSSLLARPRMRKPSIPLPWRRNKIDDPNVTTSLSTSYSASSAEDDTHMGQSSPHSFPTSPTTAAPSAETVATNTSYAWQVLSSDTVGQDPDTNPIPGRTHQYTLDKVYGATCTTQQLYDSSVKELVLAAMEGYHASVLAYGQTSTGKTHTMSGTPAEPGLIPLAIRECFAYLHHRPHHVAPREYLLRVSYLEVYKEHVRDLLVPVATHPTNAFSSGTSANGSASSLTSSGPPIRLFDSPGGKNGGLIIRGLREEIVTTPDQVFEILALGESRRQIGATHLNQHSSRSHVMVRLCIESREATSLSQDSGGTTTARSYARANSTGSATGNGSESKGGGSGTRVSTLCLVDLAGSESVRLTGSADRRQEGHYINKSLMTLGQVVYALSEQQQQRDQNPTTVTINSSHIPYRDSKLTRLLQPSLSGQAQVVILCCISPLPSHIEESHNTFKFATRAKKIPQKATIQESTGQDDKTLLQSYRDEIEELRQQLRDAEEQKQLLLQQSMSPASSEGVSVLEGDDVVTDEEINALVQSIQTMEQLILKSNSQNLIPPPGTPRAPFLTRAHPEDWLDSDDGDDLLEDDDVNDEHLLALANPGGHLATPARHLFLGDDGVGANADAGTVTTTASSSTMMTGGYDKDLQLEFIRIQGLLHSVLKKRRERHATPVTGRKSGSGYQSDDNDDEVRKLRAQLEQQEAATNMRKADSSFLQAQLEEKDNLLQEVSKILEAMEVQHIKLERENVALRRKLAQYEEGSDVAS